jgi:small subunit ribosomal protein S17
MATVAAKAAAGALAGKSIVTPLIHSQKVGVVVSAGKMSRAVKVRVAGHEWNKKFRKVRLYLSSPA